MEAHLNNTATDTAFSMGSTVNHAAVPPRSASDGGSGWAPLKDETPPLRKPAVLVTFDPDSSQGTPDTAISADFLNMGSVPSRSWSRRVVLEQLAHWQALLFGAYLANGLLAITLVFMLRYLRLVIRLINVYWTQLFQATALPFVVVTRFVHDRRYALFRRRAVYTYLLEVAVPDTGASTVRSTERIDYPIPIFKFNRLAFRKNA